MREIVQLDTKENLLDQDSHKHSNGKQEQHRTHDDTLPKTNIDCMATRFPRSLLSSQSCHLLS